MLQVRARRGQLPSKERGLPHHAVRVLEQTGVLHVLGEGQTLLCQFLRYLQLPLIEIKPPQAHQCCKTLRTIPHLLGELVRPSIGVSYVRRCMALDHPE